MDLVIDSARDVIRALVFQSGASARTTTERWFSSSTPLLRRLAIHGVDIAPSLSPDEKVQWVLDRDLVFDTPTKHEVFVLLRNALPATREAIRERLLRRVRKGLLAKDEPKVNRETRDYERYNVLVWLTRAVPEDESFAAALRREQERHPDFAPREHPDADISEPEILPVALASVDSVEELLLRSARDESVVRALMQERGGEWPFDGRRPIVEKVAAAVAKSPSWGIDLAETLGALGEWRSDLWRALLQGWPRGDVADTQWKRIFEIVLAHAARQDFLDDAARLLVEYVQTLQSTMPSLDLAEHLSDSLFADAVERTMSVHLEGPDWLTSAINLPGGKIAEFWLHALSLRNQTSPLDALPRPYADRFDLTLAGDGQAAEAATVLLCAQLHFVYAIDRQWSNAELVHQFEWTNGEVRAEQAWEAFLKWGRLNESLIDLMLPLYVRSFKTLSRRPREWRNHFTGHLATIAVLSSRNVHDDGWLVRFVRDAPTDDRALWASHVGFRLHELEDSAKLLQWEKWVRKYWADRIRGVPRRLAKREAAEMQYWPVALSPVFEAAVELALKSPVAKPPSHTYDGLHEQVASAPVAALRYLGHLLGGEVEPFYHCVDAISLAEAIVESNQVARRELRPVVESLARLGCSGATALLGTRA